MSFTYPPCRIPGCGGQTTTYTEHRCGLCQTHITPHLPIDWAAKPGSAEHQRIANMMRFPVRSANRGAQ